MTGNEELGFDFGEGALQTATISKESSRGANCPIRIPRGGEEECFGFSIIIKSRKMILA